MSQNKKAVRAAFRDAVFERDSYLCRVCEVPCDIPKLDAHHIHLRSDMPAGGYVKENGITLCPACHIEAEAGRPSEYELYRLIESSFEQAWEASKKLEEQ